MRALLVETEGFNLSELKEEFTLKNFDITRAKSEEEGILFTKTRNYDLIILCIGSIEATHNTALKQIRFANPETPICVLGTYCDWEHRKQVLKLGADDYLTKQFFSLGGRALARMRALVRRGAGFSSDEVILDDLKFNLAARMFSKRNGDGEYRDFSVPLKEKKVLERLILSHGHAKTKSAIVDEIYTQNSVDDNVVESHVSKLCKNFGDKDFVKRERFAGYKFPKLWHYFNRQADRNSLIETVKKSVLFVTYDDIIPEGFNEFQKKFNVEIISSDDERLIEKSQRSDAVILHADSPNDASLSIKQLRNSGVDSAICFLAPTWIDDHRGPEVSVLNSGADSYMHCSLSSEEFEVNLKNIIGRAERSNTRERLSFGNLIYDRKMELAFVRQKNPENGEFDYTYLELPRKQKLILDYLINRGRTRRISKNELCNYIENVTGERRTDESVAESHVSNLKKKLRKFDCGVSIHNGRFEGYMLVVQDDEQIKSKASVSSTVRSNKKSKQRVFA